MGHEIEDKDEMIREMEEEVKCYKRNQDSLKELNACAKGVRK